MPPTDPQNTTYPVEKEYGADHYDEPINANFNNLARDVSKAGPIADRPDVSQEFAPAFWYAVDEQVWYRNTGVTWRRMDPPYRLLSSFGSVQEAVDWSGSNTPGTIWIDTMFETNESGILIDDAKLSLSGLFVNRNFADAGGHPSIVCTNTADNEPFFRYTGNNLNIVLQNVNFFNEGNARPFMHPVDGFSGFIGNSAMWQNVTIQDFGATASNPYTLHLENAWSAYFSNIAVRNRNQPSRYGAYRLVNCNASHFYSLSSIDEQTSDGETPCIYMERCGGTRLEGPHVENMLTDAAIQITDGFVTVTDHYIEGNNQGNADDMRCGIQIGDGGKTQGNTSGTTTADAKVTIIGGTVHGSENQIEAVRGLNFATLNMMNMDVPFPGNGDMLNYGGSNNDSQSSLTVNPGQVLILNCTSQAGIVNSSGNSSPEILQLSGKNYFSDTNAQNQMGDYEMGFKSGAPEGHAIVKRDDTGTIHVFEPVRTL